MLHFYGEHWICELVVVETAFLEGELNKKVYINLPKGIVELCFVVQEEYGNACAELTGGMYRCYILCVFANMQ